MKTEQKKCVKISWTNRNASPSRNGPSGFRNSKEKKQTYINKGASE